MAKVEGTYRLIQRLTLLQVKPKKCVIIPTRDVVTPELRENIREWLRRWIPAWSEFAIEGRGKLLGVVIGPSAGGFQWLAAEAKYERRTLDIASTRAPPSVALRLHATRAVQTLGYLAQVLEPPPQAISSQLARFHALCHIPNNSFSLTAAYKMAEAGGPKFTTLRPFACAAAARAALTTLDTWEYWCRELRKISAEDGAIAREVAGLHWPSCWNTMPLAFRLEMAVSPCILRAQGEPAIGRGVEAFCTEHRIFGPMRRQRAKNVPLLQAKLYKRLAAELHSQPNIAFYTEKLRRSGISPIPPGALEHSMRLLKTVRPEIAWATLLTWAGGWPTGRRMQDNRDRADKKHPPCCFGCPDEEDSFQHYVQCKRLWLVTARVAPPRPPDLLARFSVVPAGTSQAVLARLSARTAVALHTYRSLRLGRIVIQPFGRRAGQALEAVAKVASHKFSCAINERFGFKVVRARAARVAS